MPVSAANTWATMVSKNTKMSKISTKQEKGTDLKTKPPTSQMLKEFKPATLVIRTPPGFTDLDNLSANTLRSNKIILRIAAALHFLIIFHASAARRIRFWAAHPSKIFKQKMRLVYSQIAKESIPFARSIIVLDHRSYSTHQTQNDLSKHKIQPSKINNQTISVLKKQAIDNEKAIYDNLPNLTSGFDKISIKNPSSFLKPRIHLSALPKLSLKFTRPAKHTDAYGINFGVLPPALKDNLASNSSTDPINSTPSLINQAIQSRDSSLIHHSSIIDPPQSYKKAQFGSSNNDPSCHKAASPLLAISHKKLQRLADLINRYKMSVDQAILQMKFSHKAISAQVLNLIQQAKQDAIQRGFNSNRLMIAEAWVTKGFHTSELQVRARGRHGRISHPTARFCIVLRQNQDSSKLALQRRLESRASQRRLSQRGTIPGSPIRIPGDGVIPSSINQRVHWACLAYFSNSYDTATKSCQAISH
ncbi:hypothetical protein O181_100184 [Austropuccinia psidii MF-1]|uniref:Ribosomal protein L22 n=1 Tax=Austropuccinia psidii MF-1 TaxID=1389203 RepID=A0A9Q3JEQ3_9BASI|nr:hypothetical protein [Austropuccinia psidii MF-1]